MSSTRWSGVEDTFFEELKTWSEIKLRIIEKYLDAYMKKRGGSNPVIYYIDGFAGAGYYGKEGEPRKKGSPIRVADLAQRIVDAGKPNRLICLFSERRRDYFAELQRALSQYDPSLVQLYWGPFRKHLPSILSTIGTAPAVFFLDPFGVKHITLDDLQPLLRRRDTELLLNLNTPRLRQLAGFEDSLSKDAAAKVGLVSVVLGEDPAKPQPEWLKQWNRLSKDGIRWERWAVEAYAERLAERSPYLQYVMQYPVRPAYDGNPKYWLIFATRSLHAAPIMNDLICTEEENLFAKPKVEEGATQLGFFREIHQSQMRPKLADLLEEVHAFGLRHPGCTRIDIINHFSMIRFGQFKQKHYRQAVNRLVDDKRAVFGGYDSGHKDSAPITFR